MRIIASIMIGILAAPLAAAEPKVVPAADKRWLGDGDGDVPGFVRHVQPMLGKMGCSNRACHGSFQGQNGFRLSLFASDPKHDYEALVGDERVDLKKVDESLALQKPTKQVDHKGGKRFEKDSWQYKLLRAWLVAGAPFAPEKEASVRRLEVIPSEIILAKNGDGVSIRVRAFFTDNTVEDVTALTQFSSNDDAIASIDDAGSVKALRWGDTAVVATFGGEVTTAPVLIQRSQNPGEFKFPANNQIDELVGAKLRKLGVTPSALCTDEEFLRRVSLDIAGTLPIPAEVLAFRDDRSTDKRDRKIDELLERQAYVAWWTTKLCDLTGLNAPAFLGSTDFGPLVGDLWHRWLERRVRDNAGYDTIVAGILLGVSRHPNEDYAQYATRMSSYVKTKEAADFTAEPLMPHYWFRGNITQPDEKALAVAYSFLGVRLDCAQCHKHPFDRWTQQDFQQFTALFERIQQGVPPESKSAYDKIKGQFDEPTLRNAASRRTTYWKLAKEGKPMPWPEVFVAAAPKKGKAHTTGKLLGGETINLATVADPRVPLVDWLRRPDNPYFAQAFVNRVWAHYFGRGLIDPPDDVNLANPPSNRALMDHLSRGFIAAKFDMKWLHREIARSRTYQLSWRPTASNGDDERNASHAQFRRLPAEVAVDALHLATAGKKRQATFNSDMKERKIGQQATADVRRLEYALAVFGKPLRMVNCDCEREVAPSLPQALFLRNDKELFALIDRKDGWLMEVKPDADRAALAREAYLRILSRLPDDVEVARCQKHFAQAQNTTDGLRDLVWALLNTQEFITNH